MVFHPGARRAGFTLIELLIVVAILGLIATILIPMFIDTLQRGRQKRTMASIRDFGIGIAEYWTDFSGGGAAGATFDVGEWQGNATFADLTAALVPDYMQAVPDRDGWAHPIEYRVQLQEPPRSRYALVRSPAKNGEFDSDTYTAGLFELTDYDQDVVWGDGSFIRAPASSR